MWCSKCASNNVESIPVKKKKGIFKRETKEIDHYEYLCRDCGHMWRS